MIAYFVWKDTISVAKSCVSFDGGSWRFRHKILQDYFAAQWREKYAEAEKWA